MEIQTSEVTRVGAYLRDGCLFEGGAHLRRALNQGITVIQSEDTITIHRIMLIISNDVLLHKDLASPNENDNKYNYQV